MTIKSKLAGLLATGSLLLAAAMPAQAASVFTEGFLANVRPNIDFLDRSSRLALDHSSSARVRAFARDEARQQTLTANAMLAWIQANTVRGAVGAVAVEGTVMPAGVDFATVPLKVGEDLTTGRSVALDVPVAVDTRPEVMRELLPAGQNDLDRLGAMRGRQFDAFYRTTQADALRQLQTLYASYITNGDDPTLRTMATAELSKINRRIVELRRL